MVVRLAVRCLVAVCVLVGSAAGFAVEYQQVVIKNDEIRAVISTQRASLDRLELIDNHSITLPKHLQRTDGTPADPKAPLAVLAPFYEPDTPVAKEQAKNQHAWLVNDGPTARRWGLTGKDFTAWTVTARTPTSATLTATGGDGLRYQVTWTVDEKLPRVTARIAVTNGGEKEVTFSPSLIPINGIHQDYAPNEVAYLTAFSHRDGSEAGHITTTAIPAAGAALNGVTENGAGVDFVGLKSRFFAVWWTPGELTLDGGTSTPAPSEPVGATGPGSQSVTAPGASAPTWRADIGGYTTKAHADHQGYLQITYSQVTVPSGRTLTNTWSLTASSMARSDLAAFGQAEHRIDLTDWMHRTFIIFTKPLVWILDQIVKLVPNYAIAVIILTFLVKALMFKLTWKQHASMAAMAKVAPELKYLQEQYKNDKTKLAQKQMELWKKHGVNPLGGCLPLLVQMPIFIGLFNAFQYNADMRGEHFLWISDLTLPDQIWGTPLAFLGGWVLSLNPLPIIYIAVTIWMSLSSPLPTGGDPQQEQIAKSMRWMPVLFGLIFYNMPAGLVLYFTVNALLSTIEVKFIRARLAAKG